MATQIHAKSVKKRIAQMNTCIRQAPIFDNLNMAHCLYMRGIAEYTGGPAPRSDVLTVATECRQRNLHIRYPRLPGYEIPTQEEPEKIDEKLTPEQRREILAKRLREKIRSFRN